MRRFALALSIAVLLAGVAWVQKPIAQTTFPNPTVTATTVPSTGVQIVAANGSRRSIRICNTDPTTAVWIWPGALSPAVSDTILAPITSNVAACYTPPIGISSAAGAQWNAASPSASSTHVSVEEW